LKTDFGSKLYWLSLALLLGGAAAYVYYANLDGLWAAHQQSERHVQALRHELTGLEQREDGLRRRVEHLESDPVEMEAAIRQRKNLVRPGETVYRVELADE